MKNWNKNIKPSEPTIFSSIVVVDATVTVHHPPEVYGRFHFKLSFRKMNLWCMGKAVCFSARNREGKGFFYIYINILHITNLYPTSLELFIIVYIALTLQKSSMILPSSNFITSIFLEPQLIDVRISFVIKSALYTCLSTTNSLC